MLLIISDEQQTFCRSIRRFLCENSRGFSLPRGLSTVKMATQTSIYSSEDEFYSAALQAPPHPLDLKSGDKIVVSGQYSGDGAAGSSSSMSPSHKPGIVTKVSLQSEQVRIRFEGEDGDRAFTVDELEFHGYTCPALAKEPVRRGFAEQNGHVTLKKTNGATTYRTERTAFGIQRDLESAGFNFSTSSPAEIHGSKKTNSALLVLLQGEKHVTSKV